MTEVPRMQQWNKRLRRKTADMSEKGEDVRQDLQEDRRAEDRKANSRVFNLAAESE
jgi:F0F1-type ATP synthase assembly protein I